MTVSNRKFIHLRFYERTGEKRRILVCGVYCLIKSSRTFRVRTHQKVYYFYFIVIIIIIFFFNGMRFLAERTTMKIHTEMSFFIAGRVSRIAIKP